MTVRPLLFRSAATPAEAGAPDPSRLLAGHPRFETRNHYTDATGQFFSGEWAAGPGAWRVAYEAHEEEFCVLLEGQVVITAADGSATELHPGDSFVIPGGFQGIWENKTAVRKHYAIMSLKEATR